MEEWGIENGGHRKDLIFLMWVWLDLKKWNDEKLVVYWRRKLNIENGICINPYRLLLHNKIK